MQKITFSLIAGMVLLCASALANLQPNEVYITIKGRAVIPPCTINNGTDIDINFGSVGIEATQAGDISVERWIPVVCDDTESAYSIKIWGKGLAANTQILATDVTGLGILFSDAQNMLPLNIPYKPSSANGIMLVSHLVMSSDFVNGTEGEFTANATLTTQYD